MTTIYSLPEELVYHSLGYLSFKDLCAAAGTNRAFNKTAVALKERIVTECRTNAAFKRAVSNIEINQEMYDMSRQRTNKAIRRGTVGFIGFSALAIRCGMSSLPLITKVIRISVWTTGALGSAVAGACIASFWGGMMVTLWLDEKQKEVRSRDLLLQEIEEKIASEVQTKL